MNGRLWVLVIGLLLALTRVAGIAQQPDARTLVQTSLKAMGAENLKSIQYSGTTGYLAVPGQNYSPAMDWPANR